VALLIAQGNRDKQLQIQMDAKRSEQRPWLNKEGRSVVKVEKSVGMEEEMVALRAWCWWDVKENDLLWYASKAKSTIFLEASLRVLCIKPYIHVSSMPSQANKFKEYKQLLINTVHHVRTMKHIPN